MYSSTPALLSICLAVFACKSPHRFSCAPCFCSELCKRYFLFFFSLCWQNKVNFKVISDVFIGAVFFFSVPSHPTELFTLALLWQAHMEVLAVHCVWPMPEDTPGMLSTLLLRMLVADVGAGDRAELLRCSSCRKRDLISFSRTASRAPGETDSISQSRFCRNGGAKLLRYE